MAKRKKSTFERLQSETWNRQQRRNLAQQLSSADPGLEVVHADAAGIDVGGASHYVAVPPDRDAKPVREFGSWTDDLRKLAAGLNSCGIRTVAMQSTGVYWIALYEVLEAAGLEVYVVNARGTKNLPGRKSDVQECQWLMKLHTYGLLRNSFQPPEQIRAVRNLWRLRDRWVEECGRAIQQMQKALTRMNVQLANTISDISGVTGMAIIRAIVGGQRNPWELAQLRDRRIAASPEEIARSLEGNWREDLLFELKQVVKAYDFYQARMSECDVEIAKYMALLPTHEVAEGNKEAEPELKAGTRRKNHPAFNLRSELKRILGVDVTCLDGIHVMTGQVLLSEVGPDWSAFPTENHFAAWLELSPRREVSGGKVIRHVKPDGRNRLANVLRMAAQSLCRSDSYLGARYRSLRGRLGGPRANKAMARYLACLLYRLLTKGQAYLDRGAQHYEDRRRERERIMLERKALHCGFRLVPVK